MTGESMKVDGPMSPAADKDTPQGSSDSTREDRAGLRLDEPARIAPAQSLLRLSRLLGRSAAAASNRRRYEGLGLIELILDRMQQEQEK
jgi:hypothetical protein